MYRYDFPIFKNYPKLIYLDNAATSQKPRQVIETIKEYYEKYNANVHRGIYRLSELATHKYEEARKKIALFINAYEKEIIFTSGATDSLNSLANSLSNELEADDTIIISEFEHHSNLLPWQVLANRLKLTLKYIPVNSDLTLNIESFKNILNSSDHIRIVSVTGLSNVTGTITPLRQLAKLTHDAGAIFIVDGAQLTPHERIDVKALDIDFFVFSGHKIYGPTGIGVLYGRQELLEKILPFRVGGGMIEGVKKFSYKFTELPYKFEAGTPYISEAIGLGAAIDYINEVGMDKIEKHEKVLTEYAYNKLTELDELEFFVPSDITKFKSVISFNIKGIHAHDTAQVLDKYHIAVRAGHHCCQVLVKEILKVPATVRASFGIYNDTNDVDKLIDSLKKVIMKFK